jgi:uncharacterized membrane protein
MLEAMPRTLRQALSSRANRRIEGAGRLMALFALVGALMIAAAVVLAVLGSTSSALAVGVAGVLVQAGGFLGAFWWATRRPPSRFDRGRS